MTIETESSRSDKPYLDKTAGTLNVTQMEAWIKAPAARDAHSLLPQRVAAQAALSARRVEGRSRLNRLAQQGAAKIRLPRSEADPLEAVLMNTAGGLTGGDRIAWEIDVTLVPLSGRRQVYGFQQNVMGAL